MRLTRYLIHIVCLYLYYARGAENQPDIYEVLGDDLNPILSSDFAYVEPADNIEHYSLNEVFGVRKRPFGYDRRVLIQTFEYPSMPQQGQCNHKKSSGPRPRQDSGQPPAKRIRTTTSTPKNLDLDVLQRNSQEYLHEQGQQKIIQFVKRLYKVLTKGRDMMVVGDDLERIARVLAGHMKELSLQALTLHHKNADKYQKLYSPYTNYPLSLTKLHKLSIMDTSTITLEQLYRVFVPRLRVVENRYYMMREVCIWYASLFVSVGGEGGECPFVVDGRRIIDAIRLPTL